MCIGDDSKNKRAIVSARSSLRIITCVTENARNWYSRCREPATAVAQKMDDLLAAAIAALIPFSARIAFTFERWRGFKPRSVPMYLP